MQPRSKKWQFSLFVVIIVSSSFMLIGCGHDQKPAEVSSELAVPYDSVAADTVSGQPYSSTGGRVLQDAPPITIHTQSGDQTIPGPLGPSMGGYTAPPKSDLGPPAAPPRAASPIRPPHSNQAPPDTSR